MRQFAFLILGLFFGFLVQAQSSPLDSLVYLPNVEIRATPMQYLPFGKSQQSPDTSLLPLLQTYTLTDALHTFSSTYVKNYGPGRLATTSVRGGAAVHTAVLWNGVPIQSPVLGQVDFSLLPAYFFDEVSLIPGGNGAAAGSGAIGGSLLLNNKTSDQQGHQLQIDLRGGSFDTYFAGAKWQYRNKNFYNNTRVFGDFAQNDFEYLKNGQPTRLPHAQTRQYGIYQENHLSLPTHQNIKHHPIKTSPDQKINPSTHQPIKTSTDQKIKKSKHQPIKTSPDQNINPSTHHPIKTSTHQTSLTTKIWYQYAFRQIPPTRFQARSVATQEDEALRMQAAFRQIRTNGLQEFQASYINESLVYRDSIADINSDTRTHLLQLDANREWEWTANQRLLLNARYTFTEARSSNYEGRPKRHQSALFASYRLRLAPKWKLQLDARQELVDDQLVPFIPGLRVTFDVSQQLQLSVLASRFFRLPTFNDWFWPSGNPDLRPENGWGQELGLQWTTAHLNISLNGFHKQMQDWIIWLPNGPDYTPQNVKTVRIIGTDLQVKWQQSWHDWQLRLEGYAQWLQAQNQESRQAGDASLGLQLIYTPLWQGRFQTNLQYRDWQLFYQQNYTGQVFTTIDHSDGLGAFSLGDLRLAKAFNWKGNKWLLYASVRNIWDVDYEVVAQRPMPGRMLEFGLQLKLKQN